MLPAQRIVVTLGLLTAAIGILLALSGIFWAALQIQPSVMAPSAISFATMAPSLPVAERIEMCQLTSFLLVVGGLATTSLRACCSFK